MLGRSHRDRLEYLEKILAAALLTAALIVRHESGFITRANLPHVEPRSELDSEFLNKFAKVHPLLRVVIDHPTLGFKRKFGIDDRHVQHVELREFAALGGHPLRFALSFCMKSKIFLCRNSKNSTTVVKWVIPPARCGDVITNFLPGHRRRAPTVWAGRGQERRKFHASVSPYDEFGAAPRLEPVARFILTDLIYASKPDNKRLARLGGDELLLKRHRITTSWIGIFLEDRKLKDGHRNSRRGNVSDRGPLDHQTVTGRGVSASSSRPARLMSGTRVET